MNYKIIDERLYDYQIYPKDGDAGIDLRACVDETTVIPVGEQLLISSGIQFAIPKLWVGAVTPRSGLGTKKGTVLANTVGVIDSTYRGVVFIALKNKGTKPLLIRPMERIVQMVVVPHYDYSLMTGVDNLDDTERGSSGFGSSGVK